LAIFSCEDAYVAVNARTGKEIWRIKWPTQYGVNAADPIVAGDQVLVSSGYNKGAGLFPMTPGEPKVIWKDKVLRTQINSCILWDGFVYGIDSDTAGKSKLTCVELKTGTVKWSEPSVGFGSLMAANGRLIALSDVGVLMIAPASAKKFTPSAKAKVLDGKCWTAPVLANGRVYCRNAAGDLVCVDLRSD
jgi:outer membrane protein assembly factor BamB